MMQIAKGIVYEEGRRQVGRHAKSDVIGFYQWCGYRKVGSDEPSKDPKGINMAKYLLVAYDLRFGMEGRNAPAID